MDDIEIGTNVFVASAHQDYFSLWLQVEGKKQMLNNLTYYVHNSIANVI
jgi:hypothetical protein